MKTVSKSIAKGSNASPMGFGKIIFLAVALITFSSTLVCASQITVDLKSTIDQVLLIINDEALQSDQNAKRIQLRAAIDQRFDYRQMSMRALSKNWRGRTPEERKNFVELFKNLLEKSYAKKIEAFGNGKVEYFDEVVKGKYAMVKTKVSRKDKNIGIDYKLIQRGEKWMVYDIVVEGVSLIQNYRSQFTKIIQEDSFDGLMRRITTANM
jgi:phospholipid transport system substrate-binding protein